jgi:hypothetical protein
VSQGGSNAPLLAALAVSASRYWSDGDPRWTLQHRAAETGHWLVIGHFPTKKLAEEAARAFVAADYGPEEAFRVRRMDAPVD